MIPSQLKIRMFLSALSMSSLKLFLFCIFNLRNVATLAPKTKPRTGTRICPTRQLDCIHISFATFDMPNFFPSHRLDFKRLIGHIFGQVIKSCIRWDFNPCRTSDCITPSAFVKSAGGIETSIGFTYTPLLQSFQ